VRREAPVEFRVLGPVEVRVSGRCVDAGHARQRSVLAVLLLDLGQVVPAGLLIDRVWGEDPPRSVRNVLYGYVGRLRTVIAGAGDPGVALTRYPGGYLLRASPEQVDWCRFRRLVAQAAEAGQDEGAAVLLQDALGLWHGPGLAGLSSPWLEGVRDRLEMERSGAVLDLNDIRLRQGQHGVVAGELAGQAVALPGDERLICQLMLALYRCGRQAEALRWFERIRRYLADEFGVDPGSGLQALHKQILIADPVLDLPEPQGPAAISSQPPVLRELPAPVACFVGRSAELATLTGLLGQAGEEGPETVVISAIGGTAGWATRNLEQIHAIVTSRDMRRPAWWVRHQRTPTAA
jgi:DNA-binding SARP family transcriptional activator